jgi:peptide/nickel transport system substrate-binding protein
MIPWLAESHEYNKDFTQVTIAMRKGVKWNDGQPLTARDVAFTLNFLKEAGAKVSYGPMAQKWIKTVTVVNDQTVKIDLTEPYARFILENFAVHIWGAVRILPEHIWKGQDPTTFKAYDPVKGTVFSGPYKLVKVSESEFIFDRDDNWWGKAVGFKELPAPERVIFVDQGPQERRVATLQNNEVDGHPSINAGPFQSANARNKAVIGWTADKPWSWVDPCPGRMLFNCAKEPWSDPEMRWALNYGLDKVKYIEVTSEGLLGKEALSRFVFPDYPPLRALLDKNNDLYTKYPINEYSPQKAKDILAKKGYKPGSGGILNGPDGKPFSIVMVVGSPAEGAVMTGPNFMAEQYKALGIDVNIKQLSGAARTEAVLKGDYDLLPYHNCGGVVDPWATLDNYHVRFFTPIGTNLIGGGHYIHPPNWWMTTLQIVMNLKPK